MFDEQNNLFRSVHGVYNVANKIHFYRSERLCNAAVNQNYIQWVFKDKFKLKQVKEL